MLPPKAPVLSAALWLRPGILGLQLSPERCLQAQHSSSRWAEETWELGKNIKYMLTLPPHLHRLWGPSLHLSDLLSPPPWLFRFCWFHSLLVKAVDSHSHQHRVRQHSVYALCDMIHIDTGTISSLSSGLQCYLLSEEQALCWEDGESVSRTVFHCGVWYRLFVIVCALCQMEEKWNN